MSYLMPNTNKINAVSQRHSVREADMKRLSGNMHFLVNRIC